MVNCLTDPRTTGEHIMVIGDSITSTLYNSNESDSERLYNRQCRSEICTLHGHLKSELPDAHLSIIGKSGARLQGLFKLIDSSFEVDYLRNVFPHNKTFSCDFPDPSDTVEIVAQQLGATRQTERVPIKSVI